MNKTDTTEALDAKGLDQAALDVSVLVGFASAELAFDVAETAIRAYLAATSAGEVGPQAMADYFMRHAELLEKMREIYPGDPDGSIGIDAMKARAVADAIRWADCNDPEFHAIAATSAGEVSEPVAWQRRMLPHEKVRNTNWHNIEKEQYDFAISTGGGVYGIPEIRCEVRPLYTAPPALAAPVTAPPQPAPSDAMVEAARIGWECGRNSWCPADILEDKDRTERSWLRARSEIAEAIAALAQTAPGTAQPAPSDAAAKLAKAVFGIDLVSPSPPPQPAPHADLVERMEQIIDRHDPKMSRIRPHVEIPMGAAIQAYDEFAAELRQAIAALAQTAPGTAQPAPDKLPCDVQLPGVLLKRGVAFSTLLLALDRRKGWTEAGTTLAARPGTAQPAPHVDLERRAEEAIKELWRSRPAGPITPRDMAIAALSAVPSVEGWQTVPIKHTREMAVAAAEAHYGKRRVAATGIDGISMTVDGIDYNFTTAFKRFWKAALAAAPLPSAPTGGE